MRRYHSHPCFWRFVWQSERRNALLASVNYEFHSLVDSGRPFTLLLQPDKYFDGPNDPLFSTIATTLQEKYRIADFDPNEVLGSTGKGTSAELFFLRYAMVEKAVK